MRQTLRDHLGREVAVPRPAERIVSLCPSLTETLFALGAGPAVIGRTGYCTRPAGEIENVPEVGGTGTVVIDQVLDLKPDLVIASREENEKDQVEALAANLPVFVVDVRGFGDALRAAGDVGELAGKSKEAAALVKEIAGAFARLRPLTPPVTAAYLVWREPYIAAGGGTYIDSLMKRCGLANVLRAGDGRYPRIALRDLASRRPNLVLLGSEPYPFGRAEADEIRAASPESNIQFVDGEMFAWYGARMREAAGYLARLCERLGGSPSGD